MLRLRDAGEAVRLICACPYQGFERGWKQSWRERYEAILSAADLVRFICPGYSRSCFQRRNEWMVDHAARVIAVWNGQPQWDKEHHRLCEKADDPDSFYSAFDSLVVESLHSYSK